MTDGTRAAAPPTLASRIRPAADEHVDPIDARLGVASSPARSDDPPPVSLLAAPAPVELEPAPVRTVVDSPPAPAEQVNAAPRRTRRQEVVVQLGTRVRVETRDLLDDIADREGISIRHALEKAIEAYARQP